MYLFGVEEDADDAVDGVAGGHHAHALLREQRLKLGHGRHALEGLLDGGPGGERRVYSIAVAWASTGQRLFGYTSISIIY